MVEVSSPAGFPKGEGVERVPKKEPVDDAPKAVFPNEEAPNTGFDASLVLVGVVDDGGAVDWLGTEDVVWLAARLAHTAASASLDSVGLLH